MNENKHFFGISSDKPPKRLFRTIVNRLKLEKKLRLLIGKLSLFSAILSFSIILIFIVFFVFKSELAESETGFFLSFLLSDTAISFRYFEYLISAVLESMPITAIAVSLFAIFLLMTSLRFVVRCHDKFLALNELIKKH